MTHNPHTSTHPNWVARLGTATVPLATTTALVALVAAWGVLDLPTDGLAAIGTTDPVTALLLGAFAAAGIVPVVLGARALLARRYSSRRAWATLAVLGGLVAPTAALGYSLATAPGQVGTLGLGVLGQVAMLYGAAVALTALALAGPALGVWLRRRSLPTDRRVWLAGAVVLAVLAAGPYVVGAMVDGGESDGFDAGDEWNGTVGDDEQAWNDSGIDDGGTANGSEDGENSSEETDDTAPREPALSALTCAGDAAAGLPTAADATPLDAPNATVEHYPPMTYYESGHVVTLDASAVPGDVIGASATTNGTAIAVAAEGAIDVQTTGGATRVWIDTAGGERYVLDVCPGADE